MATIKVFSAIDEFVNGILDTFTSSVQTVLSSGVSTILVASITLYIVIFGYMVWAGKIQLPLHDIVWNLVRFAIIIAFIQNAGDLLDSAKEAIKEISTIGTGGEPGLSYIDDKLEDVGNFAENLAEKASWYSEWVIVAIVWIGFYISTVPVAILLLLSKFTLYFLLAFAPIFLFCLMWGWLKDSFNNYLTAILSNALIIIAITTIQKTAIEFLLNQVVTRDVNPFYAAFAFLVFGWFTGAMIVYVTSVVKTLMRVSIDKAPRGMNMANDSIKNGASNMANFIRNKFR